MPAEMFGEVTRGFDRAGPDNEPQSRLVKCLEVGHRQHAGVGDHHHFAELVSGRELVDDRDDGGLFIGVFWLSPANTLPEGDVRAACPI